MVSPSVDGDVRQPARGAAPRTDLGGGARAPGRWAALTERAPWLRRPILWQSAGLLLITVGVLAVALVRFDSYITFGNFELPYASAQYRALLTPPWVWTPNQYYGIPTPAPYVDLVNYPTEVLPLSLLALAVGPVAAAKLFMVASTVFLGVGFLLFARTFVRSPTAQFLAAAFLIVGPFQLALYGQGDFQQFVSEGLIFLGLAALARAVERPAARWVYFPASLWLLVLSLWSLQLFMLGVVLYLGFGLVYVLRARNPVAFWRAAVPFLARSLMLPVLLLPLVVTVLFGALNLGATSPQALPLTTYVQYSTAPWRIFFLFGYFNLNYRLLSLVNVDLALFWAGAVFVVLAFIWVAGFVCRDARVLLFFCLALAASFFGGGAAGPLAPLNEWVYLHVSGFQALNASYYWDWMIVAPAYALAAGAVYEDLRARSRSAPAPVPVPLRAVVDRVRRRYSRPRLQRYYRWGALALAGGVILLAAIPYGALAPYQGPGGMHAIDYPADYAQLPSVLDQLVGSNYAGIALFNPDVNWFLFNSSYAEQNVFFLYPTVRTVGISTYGSYPTQTNTFAYWVYQQFYLNSTRYVGELFATIGVEYFLVFYGTQAASGYPGTFLNFSYGKNASQLMSEQVGVVPVYSSASYVLYRNLYYGGVSAPADRLSIVAGDYGELNAMAYTGVNLTDQALVYTTDLTPRRCAADLPLVQRVYPEDLNALLSLGLQCNYLTATDPVDSANPGLQPNQAWTISTRVQGVPSVVDSWPGTLALSDGGPHALRVPVSAPDCGATGCSLWVPVRFGADGGTLEFTWAGTTELYRTDLGYEGYNNSMVWVQLPFVVGAGSGVLTVEAVAGWNAIGSVLVEGPAFSSDGAALSWVQRELPQQEFIQSTPAVSINLVDPGSNAPSGGQGGYYVPSPSVNAPGGYSLLLRDLVPQPIELPLALAGAPQPGWLSLLIRGGTPGTFEVVAGRQEVVLGFSGTGPGAPGDWVWDRLFVNSSGPSLGDPWSLTLESGSLYLAQVSYVPASLAPPSNLTAPGPNLAVTNISSGPGTSNLTVSTGRTPTTLTIEGTARLASAPYGSTYATIHLNGTVPRDGSIAFEAAVDPGFVLSLAGQVLGGSTAGALDFVPNGADAGGVGLSLGLLAYRTPLPASGLVTFVLVLGTTSVGPTVPFGDLGPPTVVSSDSSGYRVETGAGAPLLLVRAAYYDGLESPTSGVSLDPALGSLTTLVWNPGHAGSVRVTTADAKPLADSLVLVGGLTAAWVLVEFLVPRWTARRRAGRPPASSVGAPSPEPTADSPAAGAEATPRVPGT